VAGASRDKLLFSVSEADVCDRVCAMSDLMYEFGVASSVKFFTEVKCDRSRPCIESATHRAFLI